MNMKRMMILVAVVVGTVLCAFADAPTLSVSNVAFRQRYPWNGLVDIDCDVTCSDPTTNISLYVSAKGTASVAGEFVSGYDEKKQKYTTVKASGTATLVPVDAEHGAVFIYLTPKGLIPHARCLAVPWPKE